MIDINILVPALMFIVVMVVAAICCIPPFLQAKEYHDKLAMAISVICFLAMIGLIVAMVCKIFGII